MWKLDELMGNWRSSQLILVQRWWEGIHPRCIIHPFLQRSVAVSGSAWTRRGLVSPPSWRRRRRDRWRQAREGKKKDSHDPALPFPLPWICPRTAALRPRHRSSDGASPPPPILVVLLTLSSLLSLRTAPPAVHEHASLPFVSRRNHVGESPRSHGDGLDGVLVSLSFEIRCFRRTCSVKPCDGAFVHPLRVTMAPSLKAFWTDLLPWAVAILQETDQTHERNAPSYSHTHTHTPYLCVYLWEGWTTQPLTHS